MTKFMFISDHGYVQLCEAELSLHNLDKVDKPLMRLTAFAVLYKSPSQEKASSPNQNAR